MTHKTCVSVRHAGKVYDAGRTNVVALQDVSFEIPAGKICVLVGPSGCGKTTLLNAVAGFDQLSSGEIILDGNLLASPQRLPTPGADRLVVFQNGALFPWKTVLWNVTCGPVMQGRASRQEAEVRAREFLAYVGLEGIESRYPNELSGGMKRRVEIIRALMNDPKVLLLDEPFRALDALTKSVVQQHLLKLHELVPKTIFFITHDIEEAVFLADQVVVMTSRPGRIKELITVDLERPRTYRTVTSYDFIQFERRVREAIYDEAKMAFESGERELA